MNNMAKKKELAERLIVLPNGDEYKITGETGKYWICGDTQFFKHSNYPIKLKSDAQIPEVPVKEVDK